MSPPPSEEREPRPVTRRAFMAATGAVMAASAVSYNLFAGADAASAAVAWGHPFTFYSGRSRGFTGQWPSGHAGIDYTPGAGTPIHAVADGQIFISGVTGSNGAYGESIWIQHADGYRTIYAHMQVGTRVPVGPVTRGQYIGRVGNTGNSFGAHLHIELHYNNVAINPDPFINAGPLAGGTGSTQPAPSNPVVNPIGIADMTFLCMTPINGTNADAGVYRWIIDPAAGTKRNIDGGEYEYLKTVGYREVSGLQPPVTSARYQQIYPQATNP